MPGYVAANVAARKYGVSKWKLPKITFHSFRNSRKKEVLLVKVPNCAIFHELFDFSRLCRIVRFSVDCAKSHHRVMSDALNSVIMR